MIRCPNCAGEVPSAAAFCPACGTPISSLSQMPTVAPGPAYGKGGAPQQPSTPNVRPPSSGSFLGGFAPGTILVERYRIMGLLGKGGMGEVYRADDLKLGQAVALKFLPRVFERDPAFLERFLAEVRTARQVSHPNVCRVYDVDDVDGRHFISMEYVDGEDLATLLRRIGRLPPAKALEIAQQLCSGLAAAHAQGVLHRDLKPSNIMIDGHGRARIADFGLAIPANDAAAKEFSGTPAYMAPEQLAGEGATVRSDIYALGLVLYELYTGKRAFEGTNFAELRRAHAEHAPAPLSSLTSDMDPVVETAILRCLEKNPARRPASALQLGAALPGGDPLAAAIAAGETPSPEMVAAAGEEGSLAPAKAWALLAAVTLLLVFTIFMQSLTTTVGLVRPEKPPAVMEEKAREILRALGYEEVPADSAGWYTRDGEQLAWRQKRMRTKALWQQLSSLEPTAMNFTYRQSPRPMVPVNWDSIIVTDDPPLEFSGMANLSLDMHGRLRFLKVIAPQYEENKAAAVAPDWNALFVQAGLEMARFSPVEAKWTPTVPYDVRMAWEGQLNDNPDEKFHITAAAFRGKPVYFSISGPWNRPTRQEVQAASLMSRISGSLLVLSVCLVLTGCGIFARRNVTAGRGDGKGAFRLAVVAVVATLGGWAFTSHFVSNPIIVFGTFMRSLNQSVFLGASLCLMYLALEPPIRRRMPELLISWSRVLGGRLRDPLVGRDVLIGLGVGLVVNLLPKIAMAGTVWFALPGGLPPTSNRFVLGGFGEALGDISKVFSIALVSSLGTLSLYFFLRLTIRWKWLGVVILILMHSIIWGGASDIFGSQFIWLSVGLLAGSAMILTLVRFGLVASYAAWAVMLMFNEFRIPLDMNRWYGYNLLAAIGVLAALAVFGFYTSLGGQPVFGKPLEDA